MRGGRRPGAWLWRWGPVALFAALVTVVSHQPALAPPGRLPDWLLHTGEFAVLAALTWRALRGRAAGARADTLGLALAGCVVFAALDEAHQSFVPGRDASLRDIAADTIGAALVFGVAMLVESARARRTARAGRDVEILIYGRKGCHLCDEAERDIREETAGYPVRISKVDVDVDAALRRSFGDQVPVVMIDGRKAFKLRVDRRRLRRHLDAVVRERPR